ncbi:MAG: DUF523 domain-containing protein [Acholeplasmatales bacterium]|nr:DUF523 domain-containing protein [Acholeplasmatales bacterium]
MEKLLISGCLLGRNCKYNGGNNYASEVEALKDKYELIVICPEVMGGLSTPRDPSERLNDKILSSKGKDVTKEFTNGAKIALELALKNGCTKALLKDGSPSCGSTYIYDGTFSHNKIKGYGVTTEMLINAGIEIYTEKDIEKL